MLKRNNPFISQLNKDFKEKRFGPRYLFDEKKNRTFRYQLMEVRLNEENGEVRKIPWIVCNMAASGTILHLIESSGIFGPELIRINDRTYAKDKLGHFSEIHHQRMM